jgi:UDP-hydrolysing UDP-N-acetyl-D-glucosamine 2-epimerase
MSAITGVLEELKSDIVLVVGDRVEAFAAAAAGHIAGCVVAHVHGGDRALGQVDDSLRHAITKLAHVHFPATTRSARRIVRLGEDDWRIHAVGSPGLDDLPATRRSSARRFDGLLVLHPVDPDDDVEFARAQRVVRAMRSTPLRRIVVVQPNNDPGAGGIIRCWREHSGDPRIELRRSVPRDEFLALMRDAAVMVGNSSSGIIEAASFGTPVIDVGPRQRGRERSQNVTNVPYSERSIRQALLHIWNDGRPIRFPKRNVYGRAGAGRRIAGALSNLRLDDPRLRRKLIAY